MTGPAPTTPRERALARASAIAIGLAAGFLASTVWLATRAPAPGDARFDEGTRRDAVDRLVRDSAGIWDGHTDPDVGRVLQPGLVDREAGRTSVSSNAAGMRDREPERPKPPGTVRVVLLGDSYVHGNGVAAEERLGVHLEAWLRATAPAGVAAEVLHLGAAGWNVVAESAYLRRQLDTLQPDLVVHVFIYNDLDDAPAARGFGAFAAWTSQRRRAGDGMLASRHPTVLGYGGFGHGASLLDAGLDGESRERFERAGAEVERLQRAVLAQGGRYLAVLHWPRTAPLARRAVLAAVPEERVGYVPASVRSDPNWRVSDIDPHWNPAAHERVAELVHALCVEQELLPELGLERRPAADAVLREWHAVGRAEAAEPADDPTSLLPPDSVVRSFVDLAALDRDAAAQVHGGWWPGGLVSPYASICLRNDAATELVVRGSRLGGSALAGATARVLVDEVEVGRLELAGEDAFEVAFALPPEVADRPFLSARFESDDWVLTGEGARRTAAFVLRRVELR